jgi:peptide-methionine (S)-S-oxide reductase
LTRRPPRLATILAGGTAATADYESVSSGRTGHAESVQITFDPARITYVQFLRVFFSVAHDPTEWKRQGLDEGSQYRSVIFYANDELKKQFPEPYDGK